MNRAIVHSFMYVLKVWFTAAFIAYTFVILAYAVNKKDDFLNLLDTGVLFQLGMMFLFHSLIVCSLMLLIVRYIILLKWNTFLIRLIVSVLWFGATVVSVLLVPWLLLFIHEIFYQLQIQISTAEQDDIALDTFAALLIVWPLASVFCAWCYRIRPGATSESILPE